MILLLAYSVTNYTESLHEGIWPVMNDSDVAEDVQELNKVLHIAFCGYNFPSVFPH